MRLLTPLLVLQPLAGAPAVDAEYAIKKSADKKPVNPTGHGIGLAPDSEYGVVVRITGLMDDQVLCNTAVERHHFLLTKQWLSGLCSGGTLVSEEMPVGIMKLERGAVLPDCPFE